MYLTEEDNIATLKCCSFNYRAFLQGVQRRSRLAELMGAEFRDREDLEFLARETDEILAEIEAEEAASQ